MVPESATGQITLQDANWTSGEITLAGSRRLRFTLVAVSAIVRTLFSQQCLTEEQPPAVAIHHNPKTTPKPSGALAQRRTRVLMLVRGIGNTRGGHAKKTK